MTQSRQSDCQVWEGFLNRGYGPHRKRWRRERGPIPRGYHLHHRCAEPRCINLDHLELLPAREHFILTFLEDRGRTIEDVYAIRRLGRAGVGAPKLMVRFNLSRRTVDAILNGEVWREETGGERVEPDRGCAWCAGSMAGKNRHAVYCCAAHRGMAHKARSGTL